MKKNMTLVFAIFMAVCLWATAAQASVYPAVINDANAGFADSIPVLRDDPIIILGSFDSLNCSNFDFEECTWLPYFVNAQVQNAENIQWTTSGDGTFDNAGIASPNYFIGRQDRLNNLAVLTISATGNGTTVSAEIVVNIPMQLIPVTKNGFTGMSSYVEKSGIPVPEVMAPVVENLIIMLTVTGSYYWPEPVPPINQIGDWDKVGYQAKFKDQPACLPIYGNPVLDQTFLVSGLMTYLPVLTDHPVAIEELLAGHLDDIHSIFDYKDSLTWTPEHHEFEYLKPGLAYRLVMANYVAPFFIGFPAYSWGLSINIPDRENTDANIYPNPSDGIFCIKLDEISETAFWEVINPEGKTISNGAGNENFTVNLTSQPKGIYYLKIAQGGLITVKKLVLQ